jgi:hypothetical protein
MRFIVAGIALFVSMNAGAATLVSKFEAPTVVRGKTVKATGPTSIKYVRVQYGTCNGDQFGVLEGSQTLLMPASEMSFEVPYRRTCTKAQWRLKNGTWSVPIYSIAEAA